MCANESVLDKSQVYTNALILKSWFLQQRFIHRYIDCSTQAHFENHPVPDSDVFAFRNFFAQADSSMDAFLTLEKTFNEFHCEQIQHFWLQK